MMEEPVTSGNEERKLISQSAFLYVAMYLAIVFKFAGGFLIARFLGPVLYGLRTGFGLVVDYEFFMHLGTYNAMGREVPYYRGGNDEKRAEEIINNVFGVNLLYSLVVGTLLLLVAAYLHKINFERIYIDFVIFMSFYIFVDKFRNFYNAKLMVDKRTALLSQVTILYSFANAVAGVILVYYFSLQGLFIGLLIGNVVTVIFILMKLKEVPAIQVSPQAIWSLLKIGFPIMLIGLLSILLRSVDRIIIAATLSSEMLGYFGIATIVSGVVFATLYEVIVTVFYPRIMEKLGETRDVSEVKNYLIEPSVLLAYFVPFLIGALFLGIHLPLQYFLPQYFQSINSTKTLVLGSFFFAVATMPLLMCIALNKQVRVVFLTLFGILANAVFSYLFILLGWGIEGVAIGTAISYFLFGSLVIWYALKQFGFRLNDHIEFFTLIYAPFLYLLCLVLLLEQLFGLNINSFWSDVFYTSLKIGLVFLLYSPALILVRKHKAFVRLTGNLPLLHTVEYLHFSRWIARRKAQLK